MFQLGTGGSLTAVTNPVTGPTNSPGAVFITGIGVAGQVLTATVSDADGFNPTGVSFDWQVSMDGGATWTSVGTGSAYTLTSADTGGLVQVAASYTDNASQAEVARQRNEVGL